MKGGVLPNNSQQASTFTDEEILTSLGFDGGELEMLFLRYSKDQLVNRYLVIAQGEPYLRNWDDETTAMNANNKLGIFKPNNIEYTKRDIAQHTVDSFDQDAEGGRAKKIRKKTLKRKHLTNKRKYKRRRTFKRRRSFKRR